MQLGEIIAGGHAEGVYRAPTKPVRIKLTIDKDGEQHVSEASAVLRFVPEDEAQACRVAAEKALRKQFPDGVPQDLLIDERAFRLLHVALRDADDPRKPFASSVDELKGALQQRVAIDLFAVYSDWCEEEFPAQVDDETFEELVEAAKKKSLSDLLSSFDSKKMRRAWPSLVAHFGKSATQTSTDGEPG